jgi:hypothetical protein
MIRVVALLAGALFLLSSFDGPTPRRAPARAGRSSPSTRAMLAGSARAWRAATPAGRRWRARRLAGNTARALLWPRGRAAAAHPPRGPRVDLTHPARRRAPSAHHPRESQPAARDPHTPRGGGPYMDLVKFAQATAAAGQLDPPDGGLPGVPDQARAWARAIETIADGYLAWVGSLIEDVGLAQKPLEPLLDAGDLLVGLGPAVAAGAQQIAAGRR